MLNAGLKSHGKWFRALRTVSAIYPNSKGFRPSPEASILTMPQELFLSCVKQMWSTYDCSGSLLGKDRHVRRNRIVTALCKSVLVANWPLPFFLSSLQPQRVLIQPWYNPPGLNTGLVWSGTTAPLFSHPWKSEVGILYIIVHKWGNYCANAIQLVRRLSVGFFFFFWMIHYIHDVC